MVDEDKEKAEKLAAAKKRFEQLKKEQQKKGKKGGKKKDGKAEESKTDDVKPEEANEEAPDSTEAVEDNQQAGGEDGESQPSLSQQSKQRSESFKQSWSARIEELERENKALRTQSEERAVSLSKAEEELESLRESSSDLVELRTKAKETDRLTGELASVQRQLAQAQQAAKGHSRRISGSAASPDLHAQLANKTSTIESLELETSNLRNQITSLETTITERGASASDLLERAQTAETATAAVQQELDALKVSIAFPSDETQAAREDPEALTKRITVLESDLRSANANLTQAATRATSLQQKIDALTKLHRDAAATGQAKDRELADLRAQLRRRDRGSHVRDASDFELGDEETETGALQARIRALEAEAFDLRRGVWRDRRAELQPGMDDADHEGGGGGPSYEDVDLSAGPYSPGRGGGSAGGQRQHSTFQDVLTSGISAFTGRARESQPPSGRERKASLGLLSEDDFDEEAYRLAQEEEAKRRIERVKEVKRGLEQWKGWRVDIADTRRSGLAGGREVGPVFEV